MGERVERVDRADWVDLVVGRKIRACRSERGWTQEELGRKLEEKLGRPVSKQLVSVIEAGSRPLETGELVAIALLFGKSVSWFLWPEPSVEQISLVFQGPVIPHEPYRDNLLSEDIAKELRRLAKWSKRIDEEEGS